jgi:mRNA-degrading endonuclease toxin of MazEF toxin-antitoxin module
MGRVIAQRGEIWLMDLGMVQKVRPVLVLSVPYKHLERTLVSYVLRTTSLRDTEYEIPHAASNFKPGAFDAPSIGTVPDVQLIRRLALCDGATLRRVESALAKWLSLSAG